MLLFILTIWNDHEWQIGIIENFVAYCWIFYKPPSDFGNVSKNNGKGFLFWINLKGVEFYHWGMNSGSLLVKKH